MKRNFPLLVSNLNFRFNEFMCMRALCCVVHSNNFTHRTHWADGHTIKFTTQLFQWKWTHLSSSLSLRFNDIEYFLSLSLSVFIWKRHKVIQMYTINIKASLIAYFYSLYLDLTHYLSSSFCFAFLILKVMGKEREEREREEANRNGIKSV